ncbi:MAG TPA: FAD-dependent oxidoreductase, partial [Pirellulales bacterium]
MYDTVIIGAGMAGLAAGIRLAYYDQKVCILERHTTIGGLNSFYRMRGRNYDVGLHAVTNFTPKGAKKGPLARLLRQLRLNWDDFALSPQLESAIAFPGCTLRFDNDFERFRAEVHKAFPLQKDRFDRFAASITDYDDLDLSSESLSARKVIREHITDPLLVDMLMLPLCYYGSAKEHDMDWGQFCVMFRSIFFEGFARPFQGVRLILKLLTRRYKQLGGELRLRAGVSKIEVADDRAVALTLDDGTQVHAKRILSSAGRVETMRMLSHAEPTDAPQEQLESGRVS